MKFGSLSPNRVEAIDGALQRLYEYFLIEHDIDKAFRITEGKIHNDDGENNYFKITEIPIQERICVPQKLDYNTKDNYKFTIKERIKILFKGKV